MDLTRLTPVALDPVSRTATIQAGCAAPVPRSCPGGGLTLVHFAVYEAPRSAIRAARSAGQSSAATALRREVVGLVRHPPRDVGAAPRRSRIRTRPSSARPRLGGCPGRDHVAHRPGRPVPRERVSRDGGSRRSRPAWRRCAAWPRTGRCPPCSGSRTGRDRDQPRRPVGRPRPARAMPGDHRYEGDRRTSPSAAGVPRQCFRRAVGALGRNPARRGGAAASMAYQTRPLMRRRLRENLETVTFGRTSHVSKLRSPRRCRGRSASRDTRRSSSATFERVQTGASLYFTIACARRRPARPVGPGEGGGERRHPRRRGSDQPPHTGSGRHRARTPRNRAARGGPPCRQGDARSADLTRRPGGDEHRQITALAPVSDGRFQRVWGPLGSASRAGVDVATVVTTRCKTSMRRRRGGPARARRGRRRRRRDGARRGRWCRPGDGVMGVPVVAATIRPRFGITETGDPPEMLL